MKYLISLFVWVFAVMNLAIAAYTPTNTDLQLVSSFSAKITNMYQENPAKINAIAPKLQVIVWMYSDETQVHYVLNALHMHIMSLITASINTVSTVMDQAPVVTQPVVTQPVVTQPTPVSGSTTVSNSNLANSGQPFSQEIANLIANGYIQWNPNAWFTILEFSDFECPFCQRYTLAGTANAVINHYEGDVNILFTHFPLDFHPLAQKAWEAAECIADQWWSIAFYRFKEELFLWNPSRSRINETFDYLNDGTMNADAFSNCIDSWAKADRVFTSRNLGLDLGVRWTPTNIFFNNSTGQYKVFQWWIDIDSWIEEIADLEPNL